MEDRQAKLSELRKTLREKLIGREQLIDRVLIGLITGGHILIEGPPGLGKTRVVNVLASAIDAGFSRIQCTPDLMPSDITGTPIFRPDVGDFEFRKGPVFHNLLLVDEINRAPPKVQSALLEAMAEQQVTSAGTTYTLPDPFLVIATQNPIEQEGTFPLPEAQLDRFLLHVTLAPPGPEEELEILNLAEAEAQQETRDIRMSFTTEDILSLRADVSNIHISPLLKSYIVKLVTATRAGFGPDDIADKVEHAISPRGSIAIARSARAKAFIEGREYTTPEDVSSIALDALSHRLVLQWRAKADGWTERGVISDILDKIKPV